MATPADRGLYMPAEWQLHDRCRMALPCRVELWGEHLAAAREAYAEVARAVAGFEPVTRIAHPDRIADAPRRLVGLYQPVPGGGRLRPSDRRYRGDFAVRPEDAAGAEAGELVLAEVGPAGRRGPRRARIVERLGRFDEPRAVSGIAIHENRIPTEFTAEALALAAAAKPVDLGDRTDLRQIPLVTIDGADARDFDDAVWAEPDPDPGNPGGWHLVVAIADVAWYVRPADAIDRCAWDRGNSVYFPDRVVPMLPEALSNDLCSLKSGEDRACLVASMWIDVDGRLKRHRFERAIMRSVARLTYDQVQSARDGNPDPATRPYAEPS